MNIIFSGSKRNLAERATENKRLRGSKPIPGAGDWKEVDPSEESFEVPYVPKTYSYISFNIRRCSLLNLFLRFYNPQLLQKIWSEQLNGHWSYDGYHGTINHGIFSLSYLYKFYAIKIRIQGLHNVPTESKPHKRPLRYDVKEAVKYFRSEYGGGKSENYSPPGIRHTEHLLSHFLVTKEYFDDLSHEFQAIIDHVGEFVAGDEKLARFTGQSGDIRLVPSKPARIGLWFYELTALIDEKTPYLLDLMMWSVDSTRGETQPVKDVVARWSNIIKSLTEQSQMCLLCFDSYYMDNAGRQYLLEKDIKYLASINKTRFKWFVSRVEPAVHKPGEWNALYNESTNEIFVYYFSRNRDIGRKYVMGNVMNHIKNTKQPADEVPGYDLYALMFSVCDRYNRKLHDKTWPHKQGGHGMLGDAGKQDDFAFSCSLQNIISVYRSLNKLSNDPMDFQQYCLDLREELYKYACTLNCQ